MMGGELDAITFDMRTRPHIGLQIGKPYDGNIIGSEPSGFNRLLNHHYVFIANGSTITEYIDGVLTTSGDTGHTLAEVVNGFSGFAQQDDGEARFSGTLEHVRMFSRVITQDEIDILKNESSNFIYQMDTAPTTSGEVPSRCYRVDEKVAFNNIEPVLSSNSYMVSSVIFDIFNDNSSVALYEFNYNANDTGNNYNGTWSGTEQYATGIAENAAKFTDNGSKITLNGTSLGDVFNGNSEWTISLWFYALDTNNNRSFIAGDADYKKPGFFIYTNKIAYFASSNGSGWNVLLGDTGSKDIGNTTISINTWYNIVLSRTTSGVYTSYINNNLDFTKTNTTNLVTSSNNMQVGKWGNQSNGYDFNGYIDNLRIFNKALTTQEIETLYTNDYNTLKSTQALQDISIAGRTIETKVNLSATGNKCTEVKADIWKQA